MPMSMKIKMMKDNDREPEHKEDQNEIERQVEH